MLIFARLLGFWIIRFIIIYNFLIVFIFDANFFYHITDNSLGCGILIISYNMIISNMNFKIFIFAMIASFTSLLLSEIFWPEFFCVLRHCFLKILYTFSNNPLLQNAFGIHIFCAFEQAHHSFPKYSSLYFQKYMIQCYKRMLYQHFYLLICL